MNTQKIYARLNRLYDQWERDSESPDIVGRIGKDWAKGVCYGLVLAIREVRTEIIDGRKPRGDLK